jgi:hypothetical protein
MYEPFPGRKEREDKQSIDSFEGAVMLVSLFRPAKSLHAFARANLAYIDLA